MLIAKRKKVVKLSLEQTNSPLKTLPLVDVQVIEKTSPKNFILNYRYNASSIYIYVHLYIINASFFRT